MKKSASPPSEMAFQPHRPRLASLLLLPIVLALPAAAQTNALNIVIPSIPTNTGVVATNPPGWITRPLTLSDALNVSLQQNGTILKAQNDLEAAYGVEVETLDIGLPTAPAGSP